MLSVGDQTLFNETGSRLPLGDILSFLWECYLRNPTGCYVGFFLSYDFTSWLSQLPEREAYLLFTDRGIKERTSQRRSRANPFPDPVVWEGWEFDLMAGRRFKLRPHTCRRSMFSPKCRNRTCDRSMEYTIGDVSGDGPRVIPAGEMTWSAPTEVLEPEEVVTFPGWTAVALLSGFGANQPNSTKKRDGSSWMFICDTGSFWQTSFLNVIDPKNWGGRGVCSDEEYAVVVRGKADRGSVFAYGATDYRDEMARYNVLENDILGRVTARLNEGFMNDDIPIKIKRNEWYGPGRAAQAWMDMLHNRIASPHAVTANRDRSRVQADIVGSTGILPRQNEWGILNADIYSSVPARFVDAARSSYYGGWFEQFAHGHVGDVWEYDINSAYPFIIASLPCLHSDGGHSGRYSEGRNVHYPRDTGGYVLIHATVTGSDPFIGCLPFRTSTGNILRPHRVRGWYWAHEIHASRRAGLVDTVEVHEWQAYTPCDCRPPFNPDDIGIARMYALRLSVGKNSPAGKALKLVYNSAYGKTAQSIGSPKYANPIYASLITAGCRTLILDAIASHPNGSSAVSMVATDGVYFLDRHPSLPLSPTQLGLWDETFKSGMTQLMPGVYWDDETRRRVKSGASPKLKSRGVPARDLAKQIDRLDGLFALAHFELANLNKYEWPIITFTQGFTMVTAKAALARGKWEEAGKVAHGTQRSISANPGSKREPRPYRDPDTGIVRTRPYSEWTTLDTQPYTKAFGYVVDTPEDVYVDRDGRDGLAYFRDLLSR
jgi:hypothetical protein